MNHTTDEFLHGAGMDDKVDEMRRQMEQQEQPPTVRELVEDNYIRDSLATEEAEEAVFKRMGYKIEYKDPFDRVQEVEQDESVRCL